MTWHPQHEIEIVAGTPPGGGLDRTARALQKAIEARRLLDVPVKVVNVAGNGGRKAWAYLERFAGDPHVVSISHPNLTTDQLTGLADFGHSAFTPLAILYTEYIAFVARADSRITTAAQLMSRIRADASSLTFALSTSAGNPNHIAVAKVVRRAGADPMAPAIRVFDSALDAVADAAAGTADVAAVTAASAVKELEAGTMIAIAVAAPQRLDGLYSQTPTWREQSVDCVTGAWRGVSGARALAPEHIGFWESTLSSAITAGEWTADLARHHWTPAYLDGSALRGALEREHAEMASILGELGLLDERANKGSS